MGELMIGVLVSMYTSVLMCVKELIEDDNGEW